VLMLSKTKPLYPGFVADSCHSGTLLDQVEVPVDGPTEGDPELPEETECVAWDESAKNKYVGGGGDAGRGACMCRKHVGQRKSYHLWHILAQCHLLACAETFTLRCNLSFTAGSHWYKQSKLG
jgi:hypothetical protein